MDPAVIATSNDVISVSHHLFLLAEDGYHPSGAMPAKTNGLADGGADCAYIHTGVHSGRVAVMVQTRQRPPESLDLNWEEVVEIGLHASLGNVRVATIMGVGIPTTYPHLTPHGPGDYRLRVSARGRDTNIDGTAFDPFEEYQIQIWPALPEPETIFKSTDRYGIQLRQSAADALARETTRGTDGGSLRRLENLRSHGRGETRSG